MVPKIYKSQSSVQDFFWKFRSGCYHAYPPPTQPNITLWVCQHPNYKPSLVAGSLAR